MIQVKRPEDVLALKDGTLKGQKCRSCDKNNPLKIYCFACQSFVCGSCSHSHQCLNPTSNVTIGKQNEDVQRLIERPVMCSQQCHEDQPLEFYCEDCKVQICLKCGIVSHNGHIVKDMHKAVQEQKIQMMEAVDKVRAEILVYENEIKKQTELKDENITDIMNAEKKMTDSVEELIHDLREHEKKMKDKFRDIYETELKQHETRLEKLELITTQLKKFVQRGLGILERNISAEILKSNHDILGRCDELLNRIKPDVYKSPYHVDYLVKRKLDLLDRILVTKTDPSMCLAEGHDSEIGRESEFVVITRDSEGSQFYEEDDQVKVDILTPGSDHLKTELKDSKDGKYTVTYTPQCAGQHTAEIQVNGQLLIGGPFVAQVLEHLYQFAFKFGSRGMFDSIRDIAVSDKTGTIAVADYWMQRIQMYSSEGKLKIRQIKLDNLPVAVSFTDCGDLLTFLPSSNNNKLRLFSEEGQFIKNINDKHLKKPQQLSITSDGRLIITDEANNDIKVLSPDGNDLLLSFVAPDCDECPQYAVYHQNKFYISYPFAHCIKVFNETGVYLHDIGCEGSNDGQFNCPLGLVVDKYNRLIVCDRNNRRLQLFTLNGNYLGKVQGGYFNDVNPFQAAINNTGESLFVDCDSSVYVFH